MTYVPAALTLVEHERLNLPRWGAPAAGDAAGTRGRSRRSRFSSLRSARASACTVAKESLMKHRFGAIVMGAGLAVGLGVTSASAAPPETNTTIIKDLVETFDDVVPTCEGGGALYTVTTTTNIVEHETVFDDGRVHATFTQTGTFVATHP